MFSTAKSSENRKRKSKMGRPKLEDPKCCQINVRLEEHWNDVVEQYCVELGISKSEVLRLALIWMNRSKWSYADGYLMTYEEYEERERMNEMMGG